MMMSDREAFHKHESGRPRGCSLSNPREVQPADKTEDDEDNDTVSSKAPSSTSSSAAPAKTSVKSEPTPGKELSSNALFPVSGFSKFNPQAHRLLSALSHDFVSAPDGKKGMRANYPKGSYTFTHKPQGGLSFYALGPQNFGLENAKEITLGYRVFFQKGFDWVKGGKLPGVYGGDSDDEAISCSGGRRSTKCFSARLMWRSGGQGEFYTYLPPYTISEFSANKKQCSVAPQSDCNPTYGASVGRGAFHFKTENGIPSASASNSTTRAKLTAKLNSSLRARASLAFLGRQCWKIPWHSNADILRRCVLIFMSFLQRSLILFAPQAPAPTSHLLRTKACGSLISRWLFSKPSKRSTILGINDSPIPWTNTPCSHHRSHLDSPPRGLTHRHLVAPWSPGRRWLHIDYGATNTR
ncbi:polysaccharide lyase family protein [Salix suchowensis]|nr:polysaccharide lyase family protein [Salix suchowensis]